MKKANITILGATGAVGREMLKVLLERDFDPSGIRCLASSRSAGKIIECGENRSVVLRHQGCRHRGVRGDGYAVWR